MPKDFRAEMEQLRKQQIIDNLASASKSLMDIKATIKRLSDEGSLIDISSQRYHKIYDQLRKLEPQVPVFEIRLSWSCSWRPMVSLRYALDRSI